MPSVDAIRTITIKGKADGIDDATAALNRLTASIAAANDNLAKSNAAAQDNSSGWRLTGEGAASAANHLRQAAEAAYAFSPAFRGVVNEMATPVLSASGTALAALATGMVTATNYAGTGLISLAGAAEKVNPSLIGVTTGVRSAGIAMEAFSPTIGTAAGSLLSFIAPAFRLLGWFTLAYDGIKLVTGAWDQGNEKLAEYVALSEKASASGLTTDFFQRITKGATDAKTPVDALTLAINKLNEVTADSLGGSSGQQRLSDLIGSKNFNGATGNFAGNSGVGALASANSTEEKFRAIVSLIDQAMQKGERLAALDVAKTFLGDAVAGNLAKDSDYLNKMLATADKVKSEDLVSQASVDNAVALQNRLDAAEKILSERWHPLQGLLVASGIAMKDAWVNIVENIASAVDWASKLVAKLADVPSWFVQKMNEGATAFMNATTTPESRAAAEKQFGISSDPAEIAMLAARQRLGSGLQNPANVSAATDQINSIQNKIFPDVSKNPDVKPIHEAKDAYDRAEESLLKYIKTTDAAAASVGKSAAEQERAKAIAQLMAAAEKDGTTVTAELAAKMDVLANRASAAADALAKAQVSSDIKFNRGTAFLSQEDVQIATQLRGIYGNDIPAALNSTYAAEIRVNNAMKEISSSIDGSLTTGLADITMGTKSVGQGFADMSKAVIRAIEEMIIKITVVQPLMKALQNSVGGSGGFLSLLGIGNGGGASVTSGLDALAAIHHTGGVVGGDSMPSRYVNPAYFDDAPRFHTGGIAGDEVPIIAKRGEGVFTQGQMAALGGGSSSSPNVIINNHTDAQPQVAKGQNGDITITLKKMVDDMVGDSLSSGTGMRVLKKQYGVTPFNGQ